jgi:hypothetical protein
MTTHYGLLAAREEGGSGPREKQEPVHLLRGSRVPRERGVDKLIEKKLYEQVGIGADQHRFVQAMEGLRYRGPPYL